MTHEGVGKETKHGSRQTSLHAGGEGGELWYDGYAQYVWMDMCVQLHACMRKVVQVQHIWTW